MIMNNANHYFLQGGGEMGELIRAKNWSKTSLGDPGGWPQSLRTMVAVMLDNPFGMYIAWGDDYTQLYNDGYRPILGATKHPQALGISTRETFSEIWTIIGPMFGGVMEGKAVGFPDFMLPLNRNGFVEDCYFDFSYSPIRKDDGEVGGVLVTVIETTNKKKSEEALRESEQSFRAMADNIPNLAWMAYADGGIYWYNNKWYEFTGTTPEQMVGWGWQSVHDPVELPLVLERWKESIATGHPFEMVFPIKGADGYYSQFLTRVLPVKDKEGKIIQWFGTNTDITPQKKIEEALKKSEQRFRETVKQAPVGITILRGRDFMVEMANDAYMQLIDMKKSEFVGKPLFYSLPEVEESVRPLLDGVLDTGVPFRGNEVPIPIKRYGKQDIYHFDFLYYPLKEESGEISGIIVTVTEVTEKVEARKKRELNEAKLNLIIDASELGTWEIDVNTNQVLCSDRFREIMGYEKNSDLTLDQTVQRIHPDYLQARDKAFQRAFETGILHFTGKIIRGDDAFHWIETKGKVFYDEQNKPVTIIGTIDDITNEKQQQQILLESEQKFRLLADSMPQHIWTSDPEGNLNYYNQSIFDYTGLTFEQINKDGWIQIVHPDDREQNIKEWLNSIHTGNDFLLEHRFRGHDGTYRWQLSRAIPQRDAHGKIQMWVGTSTDIQDQKNFTDELEKQVHKRTQELASTNMELEKMNKELQSFAYISSHDLQEPLRKIQIFSTHIMEKEAHNLSDSVKDKFTRMQIAAQRMQTLINDLLAYSRTNIQERKFEKTHLDKIIEEVKEDLKEELEQKNASLELTNICEVNIIPFQFRQLLFNLVSNALKFSNGLQNPIIKINCEHGKGATFKNEKLDKETTYCHISVADNGIGFEQHYSERIFEVFQRLHGKEEYSGTGIGLAIVKKIVDNHHGIITATGELNKGALFDIYIPATSQD